MRTLNSSGYCHQCRSAPNPYSDNANARACFDECAKLTGARTNRYFSAHIPASNRNPDDAGLYTVPRRLGRISQRNRDGDADNYGDRDRHSDRYDYEYSDPSACFDQRAQLTGARTNGYAAARILAPNPNRDDSGVHTPERVALWNGDCDGFG